MRTTMSSRRGSYSMPHHTYVKNEPSVSSCAHHHNYIPDTMEEDERMVEELLLPSPSPVSNSVPTTPTFTSSHPHAHPASFSFNDLSTSSSNTLFTTTDPFYLSQLQNSQQPFAPNPSVSQSIFAQNGRLPQGSWFALPSATL